MGKAPPMVKIKDDFKNDLLIIQDLIRYNAIIV